MAGFFEANIIAAEEGVEYRAPANSSGCCDSSEMPDVRPP